MLGELEDPDEPDDAQEGERRARLGAGAAHRRQDVEEGDVVGQHGRHVDEVLEVSPEAQLGRAGEEARDRLHREPQRARRLDDEERVEEVRRLVLSLPVFGL